MSAKTEATLFSWFLTGTILLIAFFDKSATLKDFIIIFLLGGIWIGVAYKGGLICERLYDIRENFKGR
jgi:hypothetical protein